MRRTWWTWMSNWQPIAEVCQTENKLSRSISRVSKDFHYKREIMLYKKEINTFLMRPTEKINFTSEFPWRATVSDQDSGLNVALRSDKESGQWWCSKYEGSANLKYWFVLLQGSGVHLFWKLIEFQSNSTEIVLSQCWSIAFSHFTDKYQEFGVVCTRGCTKSCPVYVQNEKHPRAFLCKHENQTNFDSFSTGFRYFVHGTNELLSSTNRFQLQFGELTELLIKPKMTITEEDLRDYSLER